MQDNNTLFDAKMRYDLIKILGYRKLLSDLIVDFNAKYSDKGISFDKAETLNYMTMAAGIDVAEETLGVYTRLCGDKPSVRYDGVTLWLAEGAYKND